MPTTSKSARRAALLRILHGTGSIKKTPSYRFRTPAGATSAQRRKTSCKASLRRKVAVNIREAKKGRYVSTAQAVAVAYSQVRKARPSCRRVLKKKASKVKGKRSARRL